MSITEFVFSFFLDFPNVTWIILLASLKYSTWLELIQADHVSSDNLQAELS